MQDIDILCPKCKRLLATIVPEHNTVICEGAPLDNSCCVQYLESVLRDDMIDKKKGEMVNLLMGKAMAELRGRVDGKKVHAKVKQIVEDMFDTNKMN